MNRLILSLFTASMMLCSAAFAEKADKLKPANIEADKATVDDQKQIQTFSGNVVLIKGTLQIKAATLQARMDEQGFQFFNATSDGKQAVTFRQKREGMDEFIEGTAQSLVFDGKADAIVLQDQAVLKRIGKNNAVLDEVKGAQIRYLNQTEFFEVKGGASSSFEGGRVKMVLTPREPKKDPKAQ